MKVKIYNKLVRDRIPEIIEKIGKKPRYVVCSKEQYKDQLKEKLLEEVNEFLAAETPAEQIEEIADIKEVILAIRKVFSLKNRDINNCRFRKSVEKGQFTKRYFLISVEDQ